MGVLLVLCHYRLHPHSEWSSMHSGAKVYGCSMRAVLLSLLLLKIKHKFISIAGLIYPISESMQHQIHGLSGLFDVIRIMQNNTISF